MPQESVLIFYQEKEILRQPTKSTIRKFTTITPQPLLSGWDWGVSICFYQNREKLSKKYLYKNQTDS